MHVGEVAEQLVELLGGSAGALPELGVEEGKPGAGNGVGGDGEVGEPAQRVIAGLVGPDGSAVGEGRETRLEVQGSVPAPMFQVYSGPVLRAARLGAALIGSPTLALMLAANWSRHQSSNSFVSKRSS